MDSNRPAYLFQRYFSQTATETEKAELMAWLSGKGENEEIRMLMDQAWKDFHGKGIVFTEKQSEEMLRFILREKVKPADLPEPRKHIRRFRTAAAAAILALLIAAGYFWFASNRPGAATPPRAGISANDVAPGGNKAMLTLAGGATIALDSARNGALAQQGNTKIVKLKSGQIVYKTERNRNGIEGKIAFNTLTTPRGGQYQLRLPDGSRVWLNAASSLKFPAAFTGKERTVELTGEAYFEIAKDRDKPFYVKVPARPGREMTVEVLGTHFDVKAYRDEPVIKTTLLEGKVKVTRGNESRLLRPSEQANIQQGAGGIRVTPAHVEDVIAWKNGFFHFNGDDMGTIMRKIERWYDVTVTYEGAVPSGHYTGIISRHTNLSEVLKMLELSGVHFRLQGRNIIVTS